MTESHPVPDETPLSAAERQTLLRIARDSLEAYVTSRRRLDVYGGDYAITDRMRVVCGAFVSLHKAGDLRGCIGHIVGREPMVECVRDNAINAATNDYRFSPVEPREIGALSIELSILSPLRPVASWRDIEIGRHGVVLSLGGAQAVFLPQVAPEQGWGVEEMLRQLARKAGLGANAWREPKARFEVFTAQVFGEE